MPSTAPGRYRLHVDVTEIDGPVCLTHVAPAETCTGQLQAFSPVPEDVLSRSGVLASIAEAGGDAKLPGVVSLSEFRTWADAVTAPEKYYGAEMAQFCSLLKVADALDDTYFDEWLDETACTLQWAAFPNGIEDGSNGVPMSAELSKLPQHLQHRVLQKAMIIEDEDKDAFGIQQDATMAAMLDFLPSHHHPTVLSAAITPDKTLIAPQHKCLPSVVAALPFIPALPASILSLDLGGDVPDGHSSAQHSSGDTSATEAAADVASADTSATKGAADVASALQHHSSLTRLRLGALHNEPPASFQPVGEAIATLTSLQQLHLLNPVPAEALPSLKVVLDSLQCLQQLSFSIDSAVPTPPPQKRRREGGEPGGVPQHCLSGLFASATALTSLEVTEVHGRASFTATTGLSLPSLRSLRVTSACHNVASALLSQLTAPLYTLEVIDTSSACLQSSEVHRAQQLWGSLPRFQQLRSLAVDVDGEGAAQVHSAAVAGAPAALASLSCLQQLSFSAAFPVLLRMVKNVAASATGLQRLRLSTWMPNTPDPFIVPIMWRLLFQHLSCLELQRLDIHINGSALRQCLPGMHMAGVPHLTQLTALHMYGWDKILDQESDCEALAEMQQLQSVCLQGLEPNIHPELVRVLGGLPCLTQLLLQPQRLPEELCQDGYQHQNHSPQAAFAQDAPRAAWPKLQWLSMAVTDEGEAVDILEAVKRFPRLVTLALGLDDHEWQPTPPDPFIEELDMGSPEGGVAVVCELDRERFAWRSALA